MFFKKFLLLLFIFSFSFSINTFAKEKPQVVFINQVRGEECCSRGNIDALEKQTDAFIKYKIPAYFVLRYDALANEEYTDYLKNVSSENPGLIRIGLMIEITPILTEHSGVKYKDIEEKWYQGQNAFLIGYEKEDRKKIIDKLFLSFKETFGYYPILTSSWMIDTDSLDLLLNKF